MPSVILYNPKEQVQFRAPYLPFSLMTIGTALKKAGITVIIVDGRIETDPHACIRNALDNDILFFGVTMMTGSMIYDALDAAALVKKIRPSITVVAGGVHPSLLPDGTVKHPLIDIVAIGPGEKTSVLIATHLQKKLPLDPLPGIAYKRDGKIIINPRADLENDCFAGVDYSLVDLRKYLKRESSGNRCLDYLSSRGCPHPCTYCSIAQVWGRKMIIYPSTHMVDTIEGFIKKLQIDAIHFLDDNFFVHKQRVEEFCDEIIRRDIQIKFWATNRIDYITSYDEPFLLKLKRAGFNTLNFGAESGSQFILDKIKKHITPAQILEAARRCNHYGFRGQFSFMMGFPFEQKEDLDKTMALIEEIHAINRDFDCQLFPYTPSPETELFYECQKYGFTFPEDLHEWARFEYGKIAMPWLTKKQQQQIDTITTIAWFAFTSETAVKLGGIKGTIFRLFGSLARLRWKYRFFAIPIEWKLINAFARR